MKIKIIVLICCLFFMGSTPVLAADVKIPKGSELGLSEKDVETTLNDVIGFILGGVAALAILMIVVSGVMMIVSQGDRDRREDAMQMLGWAIGGLVVSLVGYATVKLIAVALNAG